MEFVALLKVAHCVFVSPVHSVWSRIPRADLSFGRNDSFECGDRIRKRFRCWSLGSAFLPFIAPLGFVLFFCFFHMQS